MFNNSEKHKNFFFKILDILDENKIEYTLFAGTLLGAIRDNAFLPGDHKDTDISLDDKYYWPIRKLFEKLVQDGDYNWVVWRKEICISSLDGKTKVDMFFMEKQNDKYLVYSYKKNNENGEWDYEWRAKFTASYFFPAINYEFLGRQVCVPNNYEALLAEEYGEWQIPNPKWVSDDKTVLNTDTDYKGFSSAKINKIGNFISSKSHIAIIMTNICRQKITMECIESIRKFYPYIKIYIIDQDEPCEKMVSFYEENNVQYYYKSGDIGLSYARNFLIGEITEKYFLIIDNDFIFTEDTKIDVFEEILDQDPTIGLVAGALDNHNDDYVKRLLYDKDMRKLYYINLPLYYHYTKPNNYAYCYSDLVLNFFLARKEVWDDCKWDNDLLVAEHTDFFLSLKKTKWTATFTNLVRAIHKSERNDNYIKYRMRGKYYLNLFCKKIGLNNVNDIIHINDTSSEIKEIPVSTLLSPDTVVSKPVSYTTKIKNPNPCLKEMLNYTKDFWLLRNSCREMVVNHKLSSSNSIQIGCINQQRGEELVMIGKKYNINVEILQIKPKQLTKLVDFENTKAYIPCPVVEYLNETFGSNWRNI